MDEWMVIPGTEDTGAMGHISNTVLPRWFQDARRELLNRFQPAGEHQRPLVVVRYEVDIVRQMFPGAPITIRTGLEHIGTSSLRIAQEAWQHHQLAATGLTVVVNFDELNQCSTPLTSTMKAALHPLLISGN